MSGNPTYEELAALGCTSAYWPLIRCGDFTQLLIGTETGPVRYTAMVG